MQSMFKKIKAHPKLKLKVFDALVKPILMYGSEVWGGFCYRRIYIMTFY